MRTTRVWITLGCCLFAITFFAWAQSRQKPGLWETTSTMSFGGMTMPQTPAGMPPGTGMPPGMGGPRTTQVCVTQAMIDKFGGPYSSPQRGDCQITNRTLSATGLSANISCSGQFTGTGTFEMNFTGADTTEGKMHISGTAQGKNGAHPIEMTVQMKSVFKGADCGSVKPLPMPEEK